jgi:hypothetical protein
VGGVKVVVTGSASPTERRGVGAVEGVVLMNAQYDSSIVSVTDSGGWRADAPNGEVTVEDSEVQAEEKL